MGGTDGHEVLLRNLVTGPVLRNPVRHERLAMRRHIGARCDQGDARHARSCLRFDRAYLRVRIRRADESEVQHAGKVDVSHVAATAAYEAAHRRARDGLSDEWALLRNAHVRSPRVFHRAARWRRTVSIASMIDS